MTGKKKKRRTQRQMMKLAMKAGKKNTQDSFKMNLEDNRFNAVFDTADYNSSRVQSYEKYGVSHSRKIEEKIKETREV